MIETLNVSVRELVANKTRSALSVLGIVIGIIALIVMMSIMNGVEKSWMDYINAEGGIRRATIEPKTPVVNDAQRPDLERELTLEDAEAIRRLNRIVDRVSAENARSAVVQYQGGQRYYVNLTGGTRDSIEISGFTVEHGRPITEEDLARAENVCVLGTTARDTLFGSRAEAVGETVHIEGQPFLVIGVLKEKRLMQGRTNILAYRNGIVFVPLTVVTTRMDGNAKISAIRYNVRSHRNVPAVKQEITRLLNHRHGWAGDFEIRTEEEAYASLKKSLRTMKIGYSLIAGVSLIVGGVGILNIMMATIAQRVKEIGIRKAVGAKRKDILFQFLVESVIVSVTGGILGILLSFGVVFCVARIVPDSMPVIGPDSLILSLVFSIFVGIAFGIYPALKASRLDPIEALRYQ